MHFNYHFVLKIGAFRNGFLCNLFSFLFSPLKRKYHCHPYFKAVVCFTTKCNNTVIHYSTLKRPRVFFRGGLLSLLNKEIVTMWPCYFLEYVRLKLVSRYRETIEECIYQVWFHGQFQIGCECVHVQWIWICLA